MNVRLAGLLVAALATAIVSATTAEAACVRGVRNNDTLKVRLAPNARASAVGDLAPGRCDVRVTGPCRRGWCPVATADHQGWARERFLWVDRTPAPAGTQAPAIGDANAQREQARAAGIRLPPEAVERTPAAPTSPNGPAVTVPGATAQQSPSRASIYERTPPAPLPPPAAPAALPPARAPVPPVAAAPPVPPVPPSPPPAAAPPARVAAIAQPARPVPGPAPVPGKRASGGDGSKCAKGPGNGERLVIRAAPGARSDALYGILPGTCGIKITGTCRAGWCPIAIDSYRGWADRAELD